MAEAEAASSGVMHWYDAYRDVALTVLGASGGLASLLLVFIGFLAAQAGSFPSTTADSVPRKYTVAARWGLAPVAICMVAMLASWAWLFNPASALLLKLWTGAFCAAMVAFIVYAAVAVFSL